jgi:hypothetical protein
MMMGMMNKNGEWVEMGRKLPNTYIGNNKLDITIIHQKVQIFGHS